MSKLEREAVASLRELGGGLEDARRELASWQREIRRALQRIDRGEPLMSVVSAFRPAETRMSVDSAIDGLIHARHRTRSLIFTLAVEQGSSVSDLARTWGISRALAARYLRDAGRS